MICKTVVDIQDKGHAAGHASAEITAGIAQYNRDTAGHIFASIRAAAFDHNMRARIADGKTLSGLSSSKKLSGCRTI